jgi:DNA-binding LacI/PurR family transcriptional regulator
VLSIDLDNRPASAAAARHLRERGHSRVAVVTLPLEDSRYSGPLPADWEAMATAFTTLERLRGVRDVFSEFDGFVATDSSIDAGRIAGEVLLDDSPRPTAIIAQSDLLALGVIRAAEERGLTVPGDLSVVGFDGVRSDESGAHDLTTLVQPAVEKGRAAGRAVIRMLAGQQPEPVAFESAFHLGDTTASPS